MTQNNPNVSVIIPAYNSQSTIARAIESVLAQTYTDYQIIVIDDGSKDDTSKEVKKFGDKVKYIYQPNAGVSVARNKGLAAAKGKWIAFLDADDEWLNNKLQMQISLLEKPPHLSWCATNRFQFDGNKKTIVSNPEKLTQAMAGKDYFENYFLAELENTCPIITSTIVVQKNVFDKVGLFEPGRLRGQDIDLWWRIAYQYPAIGYVPEPLAVIHLDVTNNLLNKRRLETKKGDNARDLISKHLKLAQQHNMLEYFEPFAAKKMRTVLLIAIYHGYGPQARQILDQFPQFFPFPWKPAVYLLTVFPKFTSTLAGLLTYIKDKLKPTAATGRRWLYKKKK